VTKHFFSASEMYSVMQICLCLLRICYIYEKFLFYVH